MKINRHAQQPKDIYLEAQWLHSPYRDYVIHYSLDAHDIQFKQLTPDSYHAIVEFVAVVYNDNGATVNSIVTTAPMDLNVNEYMQAMRGGVGVTQKIAIPVRGDFFLRLGVHDVNSDHIGALEIPAESIKLPPQGSHSQPVRTSP